MPIRFSKVTHGGAKKKHHHHQKPVMEQLRQERIAIHETKMIMEKQVEPNPRRAVRTDASRSSRAAFAQ